MTEAGPHFVLPARLDSSTATTVAEGQIGRASCRERVSSEV